MIENKENGGSVIRLNERDLDLQKQQLSTEEWPSPELSAPAPPTYPQNKEVSISSSQVERDHSERGEILSHTGIYLLKT